MALNKMGSPSACRCVCLSVCGGVTKSLRGKWFWGSDFANRQLIPTQSSADLKLTVCSIHNSRHTRRHLNPYAHFVSYTSKYTLAPKSGAGRHTHTHANLWFSQQAFMHASFSTIDVKCNNRSTVWKQNNLRLAAEPGSLCTSLKKYIIKAASFNSENDALQVNSSIVCRETAVNTCVLNDEGTSSRLRSPILFSYLESFLCLQDNLARTFITKT